MAKTASFADKAKGKKKKDCTFTKYVKSERSEKTNHWRFNEQMVRLESGENLDATLKRMDRESLSLDMEMPVLKEEGENSVAELKEEAPVQEEKTERVVPEEKEEIATNDVVDVEAIDSKSAGDIPDEKQSE